jgi:hypothetical protein
MNKPAWGASWLLPENYTVAWGGRGIADKAYGNSEYSHVVSFLPDRQEAVGKMEKWGELKGWLESKVLPITLNYHGSSTEVTEVDDGEFHARYTPNGSYGYVYVIAWKGE